MARRTPIDAAATGDRLRALHRAEVLDDAGLRRATEIACGGPGRDGWRWFLERALLVLGGGLLAAGVVFFFAYNWAALDKLVKLALPAAGLLAAGGWALGRGLDALDGQVALSVGCVLVGVQLAVYGQTYQTGADAWQLFATWSALVVPWVLAARFEPLWLAFVALLELAVALWWSQTVGSDEWWLAFTLGATDGVALLAAIRWRASLWLREVLLAGLLLTWTLPAAVFLAGEVDAAAGGAALAGVVGVAGWLLSRGRDLLGMALALASLVALSSTLFGRLCFEALELDVLGMLLVGLAVAGQVSAAVAWLRKLHREAS